MHVIVSVMFVPVPVVLILISRHNFTASDLQCCLVTVTMPVEPMEATTWIDCDAFHPLLACICGNSNLPGTVVILNLCSNSHICKVRHLNVYFNSLVQMSNRAMMQFALLDGSRSITRHQPAVFTHVVMFKRNVQSESSNIILNADCRTKILQQNMDIWF